MHVIRARNVNDALQSGVNYLSRHGEVRTSRNQECVEAYHAVSTVYTRPDEMVLFSKIRNANPFLHLFEAIWMMNGGQDVATPAMFSANFKKFSDDGVWLHGAYGARWRRRLISGTVDALHSVLHLMIRNPDTRRAYLPMWEMASDNIKADDKIGSKDVPCNVGVHFQIRDGRMNMTVFCRSNDIIWGLYGSNYVHFSMLMQYAAAYVGVPLGIYTHVSNSFHAYTWNKQYADLVSENERLDIYYEDRIHSMTNPYERTIVPLVIVSSIDDCHVFLEDCETICNTMYAMATEQPWSIDPTCCQNKFMIKVAVPMLLAWKNRDPSILRKCGMYSNDWHIAGEAWLKRLQQAKK